MVKGKRFLFDFFVIGMPVKKKLPGSEVYFCNLLEIESVASCSKISGGKASIFSLTKEISDSEKSIISKMVVANIDGVEKAGEQVWQQDGYFGKVNPD